MSLPPQNVSALSPAPAHVEAFVLPEEPNHVPVIEDTTSEPASSTVRLPWWRTPSPWWLLGIMPFSAIAMSATIAPRIEIYTRLACKVHKPDIYNEHSLQLVLKLFPFLGSDMLTKPDISMPYLHEVNLITPALNIIAEGSPHGTKQCATDPVVQAAVAKLITVISVSMGILSCLTTAWWGAFSDRYGRMTVLGISVIGLLITDLLFILVTLYTENFPGGYWFLVIGPLIEGILGGMSGAAAATHAYFADTTTDENRSWIFSMNLGLLYTGFAVGPTFGSLLIHLTGHTLSVFYVATCTHLVYAIIVWFFAPESLSKKQMQESRAKYRRDLEPSRSSTEQLTQLIKVMLLVRKSFRFLSPLSIFIPTIEEVNGNPIKKWRRNWNLALVAVSYGLALSILGSYSYKFQFAASAFGWTSETLGYWISVVATARAIFLTVLLPTIINFLKPKQRLIEHSGHPSEEEPLLSGSSQTSTSLRLRHSPLFDLNVARSSLTIDILSFTCTGLFPTTLPFIFFSIFGAAGVGFVPAIQTVALALYTRNNGTESGRLFGALSVVQALWLLSAIFVSAIAWSAPAAPRIEVYTTLACKIHRPDIYNETFPLLWNTGELLHHADLAGRPAANRERSGIFYSFRDLTMVASSIRTSLDKSSTGPNRCAADPLIQATVAKFTAAMFASTGILGCLTTAWWGALSDRYGRTRLLAITNIGRLFSDVLLISVAVYIERFPGGYWFLLVGAILEGILGGMSMIVAAECAYFADTTTEESRPRIFALSHGFLDIGTAVGPVFGSLLIRLTQHTLSVFYLSACIHLTYAIYGWFVMPESLSNERMMESRKKYLREIGHSEDSTPSGLSGRSSFLSKTVQRFFSPLFIFIPKIKGGHPPLKARRDWGLAFVALSYGVAFSLVGCHGYKIQYIVSTFGWDSVTVGYWLSSYFATRATMLIIVLPIIFHIFRHKPAAIESRRQRPEEEPLLSGTSQSTASKEANSPSVNVITARCSLVIEALAYICIGLSKTTFAFVAFSLLGSTGVGFFPAIQTIALSMYTKSGGTESGRLFGALNVIRALCTDIIGPGIYGFIYVTTVAWFPQGIFFAFAAAMFVSLLCLIIARSSKYVSSEESAGDAVTVD
ncbi:hypothetical protein AMATHDRAFT_40016 [Amanita thiersii Skay4041]|uniref:Major facilitator superfamily (MFS) profile domain-containing protein n=1 Tax=Amanita thiersii Skay4041 TaxID=703135 RepID=A0A2A9NTX9_9AGAR|nr:hypothetical protein AMATHDRAFT_40016 [Amanita thiersii Skay4041]